MQSEILFLPEIQIRRKFCSFEELQGLKNFSVERFAAEISISTDISQWEFSKQSSFFFLFFLLRVSFFCFSPSQGSDLWEGDRHIQRGSVWLEKQPIFQYTTAMVDLKAGFHFSFFGTLWSDWGLHFSIFRGGAPQNDSGFKKYSKFSLKFSNSFLKKHDKVLEHVLRHYFPQFYFTKS